MKKLLVLTMVLAACATVSAEDYTFLSFEKSDGSAVSLTAVGLTMTFSGQTVEATNATTGESVTLSLADLSSMYFSSSKITTAISTARSNATVTTSRGRIYVSGAAGAHVQVVAMSGMVVSDTSLATDAITAVTPQLQNGVYIIKVDETATKILVKQ